MRNYENNLLRIKEKSIEIEEMKLTYTLFRSLRKSSGRFVYSLSVKLLSSGTSESSFVYDITRTRSRADELFTIICEGTVTPCTLSDILEDIL